MDNRQLLEAFISRQLEPAGFGHREHVAVAWTLLEQYPFERALGLFSKGARELAYRAGAPDKFHVTLTRALLHLIAADRVSRPVASCGQYLDSRPKVLRNAIASLQPHYSDACLWSKAARSGWVPPDLAPLPDLAALYQGRKFAPGQGPPGLLRVGT